MGKALSHKIPTAFLYLEISNVKTLFDNNSVRQSERRREVRGVEVTQLDRGEERVT